MIQTVERVRQRGIVGVQGFLTAQAIVRQETARFLAERRDHLRVPRFGVLQLDKQSLRAVQVVPKNYHDDSLWSMHHWPRSLGRMQVRGTPRLLAFPQTAAD